MTTKGLIVAATVAALSCGSALAADARGTPDEAMAMTKRAVAAIKAEGAQKIYPEITAKDPKWAERDLYVIVYDLTGKVLAHGANTKLVGKDLIDNQDTDGKYYVRERVELGKKGRPFWQDYKFTDPISRKIEPKSTYCEPLSETVVCVGIYKP